MVGEFKGWGKSEAQAGDFPEELKRYSHRGGIRQGLSLEGPSLFKQLTKFT